MCIPNITSSYHDLPHPLTVIHDSPATLRLWNWEGKVAKTVQWWRCWGVMPKSADSMDHLFLFILFHTSIVYFHMINRHLVSQIFEDGIRPNSFLPHLSATAPRKPLHELCGFPARRGCRKIRPIPVGHAAVHPKKVGCLMRALANDT